MMVLMRMINDHDKEGKIELVSGPSYTSKQNITRTTAPTQVVIASLGDDVTLACTAVGQPEPQLSWTRWGNADLGCSMN